MSLLARLGRVDQMDRTFIRSGEPLLVILVIVFGLTLMDNGNDRAFPPGTSCGVGSAPPCAYTTVPVFQLDEDSRTATIT